MFSSKQKILQGFGVFCAFVVVVMLLINAQELTAGSSSSRYPVNPEPEEISLFLMLVLMPAFVTFFLMLFRKYWIGFAFALWLLAPSLILVFETDAAISALVMLLAVISICACPFLRIAVREKTGGGVRDRDI